MEKTRERQNIEFETDYQLQEFRTIQSEHFKANNECWEGNHPANHTFIMEQMLKIINQMEQELNLLRKDLYGNNN